MCVSVHTTLYFNRYPTDCAEKIPCTNTVHEDKQSTRPQGSCAVWWDVGTSTEIQTNSGPLSAPKTGIVLPQEGGVLVQNNWEKHKLLWMSPKYSTFIGPEIGYEEIGLA